MMHTYIDDDRTTGVSECCERECTPRYVLSTPSHPIPAQRDRNRNRNRSAVRPAVQNRASTALFLPPRLALPRLALPCLASPRTALRCVALPCLASPRLACGMSMYFPFSIIHTSYVVCNNNHSSSTAIHSSTNHPANTRALLCFGLCVAAVSSQ